MTVTKRLPHCKVNLQLQLCITTYYLYAKRQKLFAEADQEGSPSVAQLGWGAEQGQRVGCGVREARLSWFALVLILTQGCETSVSRTRPAIHWKRQGDKMGTIPALQMSCAQVRKFACSSGSAKVFSRSAETAETREIYEVQAATQRHMWNYSEVLLSSNVWVFCRQFGKRESSWRSGKIY